MGMYRKKYLSCTNMRCLPQISLFFFYTLLMLRPVMSGFGYFLFFPVEKHLCVYSHCTIMFLAWEFLAFTTRIYPSIFHAFVVWAFSLLMGVKVQASLTLFQIAESTSTAVNSTLTNKFSSKLQFHPLNTLLNFRFKRLLIFIACLVETSRVKSEKFTYWKR